MKLSLIIPSYNEKDNIQFIYGQIIDYHLEKIIPKLEIIFVDDGSRDGIIENVRKLAQKDNRVKGMQFPRNFGKPVAILAGLKESSGDIVITPDADGQHPPALIPEMINEQKIVLLLLGGIQLLSLGIIGEYIYRIFSELKRPPHYFLQDRC